MDPKERQKERRAIHLYQGKDTVMNFTALILADTNLSLSTVLWWLVIGLIAGFLASRVMRGGGYGLVGDIVVGVIGAFIGGWLAGLLGLGANGLIGSVIIAFIGACILIALLHAVPSRSRRWRA
jgi:uncharacterized membrane protein YeaQ/YmgE (transglycosylase-associated protein family)